jgi:type II secretory pathway component PulC
VGPRLPKDDSTERDKALSFLSNNVVIRGVVPNSTDSKKGEAILTHKRDPKKVEVVVSPGSTFLDALVSRITREGVFFEYRGHKDLFVRYEDSSVHVPVGRPTRGRRGVNPRAVPMGNAPPVASSAVANPGDGSAAVYDSFTATQKVEEGAWRLDPRERDYIVKNQAKIRSEARLAPHFDKNGKADGVEVRGAAQGTLVQKRGFRKGDIVKKVNGIPVTGLDSVESLTRKFRNARQITVTFERQGVEKTITYTVR